MTLNDFITFSKTHGRDSAKLLTTYHGKDIYVGTRTNNKMRMTGYPLLMMEQKGNIIALSHKEIISILASLPDKD